MTPPSSPDTTDHSTTATATESLNSPTVTIEKLVYGGHGLGRLEDGRVVMVEGAIPQDTVTLPPPKANGKYKGPQPLQTMVTPSPHRITPPCSVFEECGGCHWQYMEPEQQAQWKQTIVEETLSRMGKLDLSSVQCHPILTPGEPWEYRNHVQWAVEFHDNGTVSLGYRGKHSHTIVPFEGCHIIPDGMNDLYMWLKSELPHHKDSLIDLQEITVRQGRMGSIATVGTTPLYVSFIAKSDIAEALTQMLPKLLEAFPHIKTIRFATQRQGTDGGKSYPIWGENRVETVIGDKPFSHRLNDFFQVNDAGIETMVKWIQRTLNPSQQIPTFVDLYAGVGTFALSLAAYYEKGWAIESSDGTVAMGQRNTNRQKADHLTWLSGQAEQRLKDWETPIHTALVDPPRAGCHRTVLEWINTHVQDTLIYVSCDPTTLARDLQTLTAKTWTLTQIQPVDLFPQTYHVETIAVLKRKAH